MSVPFVQAPQRPMIVDQYGKPMASVSYHSASDKLSKELQRWQPYLSSADGEWNTERDAATARIRDLARNDGWLSGSVTRAVDQAIGAEFRCIPMPDWEALDLPFDWAVKWSRSTAAKFRTYCNDPRRFIDAGQRANLAGLLGQGYRHDYMDGEALAIAHWMTHPGRTYATSIQLIDPDRLSNPNMEPDTATLRGGVEINSYGAPMAYHIRRAHPGDWMNHGADQYRWDRVTRYVPGNPNRLRVIHHFDPSRARAGQTRGKSLLVPVVKALRMGQRYSEIEMQAALVNAMFAVFLQSPFDHSLLAGALQPQALDGYQDLRRAYHEKRHITADGVNVIPLFPGEVMQTLKAEHPNSQFPEFMMAVLRHIAAATGQSYEQLAQDWSSTNYSSARAALNEAWKFLIARRGAFSWGFATPIYLLWLEEAVEREEVEMPAGAPAFWDMPAAWGRCRWIGPGRGWIDQFKEAQASRERMDGMLSTLQDEAADQGRDSEELMEQLAYEQARRIYLKLPLQGERYNANYDGNAETDEDADARDARERQQSASRARRAPARVYSRRRH